MSSPLFDSLQFAQAARGGERARIVFPNGYTASVVCWELAYSNGIDTYEIAVIHNGRITYDTPITDDVLGDLTKEEVNAVLIKIEALPPHE